MGGYRVTGVVEVQGLVGIGLQGVVEVQGWVGIGLQGWWRSRVGGYRITGCGGGPGGGWV